MEARQRSTPGYLVVAGVPSSRQFIVEHNLLFYLIEIIRSPLLDEVPPLSHYDGHGRDRVGFGFAYLMHRKMRRQLAFFV